MRWRFLTKTPQFFQDLFGGIQETRNPDGTVEWYEEVMTQEDQRKNVKRGNDMTKPSQEDHEDLENTLKNLRCVSDDVHDS